MKLSMGSQKGGGSDDERVTPDGSVNMVNLYPRNRGMINQSTESSLVTRDTCNCISDRINIITNIEKCQKCLKKLKKIKN